jgi:dolichol-phosphate mannosyltransferase
LPKSSQRTPLLVVIRSPVSEYTRVNENCSWAAVIPMANEEGDFSPLVCALTETLQQVGSGKVYFVVDKASRDRTLDLCRQQSSLDNRFATVWAPENKNVVDAYFRGFREAYQAGHDPIIELDAGLSHDPRAIPAFLRALREGNECAFGSRYLNGGSMGDSPLKRRILSKGGTCLARLLLGARLHDMTSGFEAFNREVMGRLLAYPIKSRAHFIQTEIRYLLRGRRCVEIPIHYRAPSPRVSSKALKNSIQVLLEYLWLRLTGKSPRL